MKFFISYYEFLKDAKSKNFSKNFKTENFRNFRKYQIFQKKSKFSNFSKSESISVFQIRNMIFLQEWRKYLKSKILGSCRNFWHCAPSWCDAEYSSWSKKNRLFSKKSRFCFFSSGGSRHQKFLSSKYSVHVAKNNNSCRNRQQMLVLLSHPFSRNFWMNLSRKKRFLRGALHFVQFWWHDFGNTTQKCSENQFQDSSTFVGELHCHFRKNMLILEGKSLFPEDTFFAVRNHPEHNHCFPKK